MSENMKENTAGTLSVEERWLKPSNRMGAFTIILCIIATFIPAIYLNIRYDAWIGWGSFGSAMSLIVVVFGVNWFIEPISYYPSLGNAGSYMSWLAGSCAQQRVPAAVVAKDAMQVKEGSQEAEVVSVVAIAGSIVTNLIVMALTCFIGTWILSVLPAVVLSCIATYMMPAMFGAMIMMFGAKTPLLTLPTFAVMIVINILVGLGIISIPAWILVLVSIIGCVIYARVLYKMGKLGGKKKA